MTKEKLVFPLARSLAAWFDTCLDEIPGDLRPSVKSACPLPWDELSPKERLSWAKEYDLQNDPRQDDEWSVGWARATRHSELSRERDQLQRMTPLQPSEHRARRGELERIDDELRQLDSPTVAGPVVAAGAAEIERPPISPLEKRAALLMRFRDLEGRRPCEGGKKGKHGALAALERETGIDDKNLGKMLDKAIEDKRGADAYAQLAQKR